MNHGREPAKIALGLLKLTVPVEAPGNAEINAQPGAAALQSGEQQYPFFGYGGGLLFHHGGRR